METKKRNRYLLFLGYGIMTVLAYAVQFTPLLPRIFGAYPAPLLLLVIIVAMHENDWCGMLYGMLCGMLTDLNALTPPGFYAVLYLCIGLICSLLVELLVQNNAISLICVGGGVLLIHSVINCFVGAGFSTGTWLLYFTFYFRCAVYNLVALILLYVLFKLIFGFDIRYKKPRGVYPKKLLRKKRIQTVNGKES